MKKQLDTLKEKIKKSNVKMVDLANVLGISPITMYQRFQGYNKAPFSDDEICLINDILESNAKNNTK